MQAASFNYDMLYKVARAISDEVRAKVRTGVHNEEREGEGRRSTKYLKFSHAATLLKVKMEVVELN